MLETERDPAAQREAAWALALLGARDRDASVGRLLASLDSYTTCRAAIALAVLQSGELLRAGPMLAADDPNEAWIAAWALFPAHVFDFHISSGRKKDVEAARRMHKRLWLDVYGIRGARRRGRTRRSSWRMLPRNTGTRNRIPSRS